MNVSFLTYCHRNTYIQQFISGCLSQYIAVNKLVSLFSSTQKVNHPCGQHIYIQEQCSTFDIDKDK